MPPAMSYRPPKPLAKTAARGYGAAHKAERARWEARLHQGELIRCACVRPDCDEHDGQCPVFISAGDAWDLGHTDDRTAWTGPECVPCNRADGARRSRISQTDPITIREWCEPQ